VRSWSTNCHPRKQKLRFACRRVSKAQSGCLSFGSQLNTERRQSATRVGLVGCLSVGSQRLVVCNGCCRRKDIPSPWLRHRDFVCLAGFVRRLWREHRMRSGSGFAPSMRLFRPAARTRVHAEGTCDQAFDGRCFQALEARQNQATFFGIRPKGAGQDRVTSKGSKCSKAVESGCLPRTPSRHLRTSLTGRCSGRQQLRCWFPSPAATAPAELGRYASQYKREDLPVCSSIRP
jgi:hypothetical protein